MSDHRHVAGPPCGAWLELVDLPVTPEPDRLVETHSAYVLMVGDRVLKWKKPLDLGFCDFRSVAARETACRAEVTLNSRLAPDVYLGVDVLRRQDDTVREHVVVMRRLPAGTRLSTLVTAGVDVQGPVRGTARLLAQLHSSSPAVTCPEQVAGPARLRELWTIGLDALAAADDVLQAGDVAEARALAEAYLELRGPLLQARLAAGMVRDGHGDLLSDDIFCLADGPRVLDCLDFDPALRLGDVLADVAMLAMDLERLGAPSIAEDFVEAYAEFSGEHHPASLLHLYIAYRAQVRAKVALLRMHQSCDTDVSDHERQLARLLVAIMLWHLRCTRTALVLVGGLPGSGKTTVAEGLAKATDSEVISSDLVRRQLGFPRQERYEASSVDAVYAVVLERAAAGLGLGKDLVLDASWMRQRHRDAAAALARRAGCVLVQLRCEASDATAERRLRARPPDHPSDADVDVRRALALAEDPWPEASPLSTAGGPEAAIITATRARQRSLDPADAG